VSQKLLTVRPAASTRLVHAVKTAASGRDMSRRVRAARATMNPTGDDSGDLLGRFQSGRVRRHFIGVEDRANTVANVSDRARDDHPSDDKGADGEGSGDTERA
jgi:hypothetical protein